MPVTPPPPQPSVRGEPSASLGRRARPTRSVALQMVRELHGHPPAPEGHAAWIARIQELADIAGEMPPVSQGANAGQPKSARATAAPARYHGATSPVQEDPRATNRDKANATTQLHTTRMPEKSNNNCKIQIGRATCRERVYVLV